MPVLSHLDVSTGHLTSSDVHLLDHLAQSEDTRLPHIQKHYAGYTVTLGILSPDFSDSERQENRKKLLGAGFSRSLVDLMSYGAQKRCMHIWFDADGEYEPGFPIFTNMTVTATTKSDDDVISETYDVSEWLYYASDDKISALAESFWGPCETADDIFHAKSDGKVLEYVSCHPLRYTNAAVGTATSINEDEALAWMKVNRPMLLDHIQNNVKKIAP